MFAACSEDLEIATTNLDVPGISGGFRQDFHQMFSGSSQVSEGFAEDLPKIFVGLSGAAKAQGSSRSRAMPQRARR